MSMTVCKFGGSSVSCADMFMKVRNIIAGDPSRRYIILSAPGKRSADDEKITDLFYRAWSGDDTILPIIYQRYASIRDALAPEFDLEGEFEQIRSQICISADYAASRGEYLCAKIFAEFAGMPFVDAKDIIFFDEYGCIDRKKTYTAVSEQLSPLSCAVIPGFYGNSPAGIHTFSRGGSDVSGALVAAALHADCYENWTDVDGLFTADPNIVPEARRNARVSLFQMESIANAGARLMHADALQPLRGRGIDTFIKNTFLPEAPGTCISESYAGVVPCVTGLRNHPCRESATVSVFGLDYNQIDKLKRMLNPIHIIHMQDHIQIITPDSEYETAIRRIHSILLEDKNPGSV